MCLQAFFGRFCQIIFKFLAISIDFKETFLLFIINLISIISVTRKTTEIPSEWKLSAARQPFSFPEALVFYMAKNPPSPEVYQKLIRCCKFFWLKNPIITFNYLERYYDDNWITRKINGFRKCQKLEIENLNENFWIHGRLSVCDDRNQLMASSIIPKIYRCDLFYLCLSYQTLSFDEFKVFTSSRSLEAVTLNGTTVENDDGTLVPMEKLIELLSNLHIFSYINTEDGLQIITSETAAKLVAIPHFHQIKSFAMVGIPESFDIEAFFAVPKVRIL